MAKYASEVVKKAASLVGKKEADGSFKVIIDTYNKHNPLARNYKVKYTDSWCATFVSAVAIMLGYTDIIPTECSCQKMIELLKERGCWVENENRVPKAGEIIFYDWEDNGVGDNKGWSDHVGYVEKVTDNVITVIEGNYSNAVKRREIAVNAKCIRGYGVPKYDAEPAKKPTAKYTVDEVARDIINGRYGNGHAARKEKVEALGLDYEVVKKRVNELLGANTANNYYKRYTGGSTQIDKVLDAVGVPAQYRGKWTKRLPVAKANGISNYTGKEKENIKLITLAKQGKLKKA
jgi:hypothetical protein